MTKTLSALQFITGVCLLSGCAFINPYDSEFSCPETSKGKCVSVNRAYNDATANSTSHFGEAKTDRSDEHKEGENVPVVEEVCSQHSPGDDSLSGNSACSKKAKSADPARESKETQNYNRYRSALYDKFGNLLKEPKTPIVAPPKTMRVLLLPYTGQENEFYMMRYVYFFVDNARWILGDSVTSNDEEE